MINPRYGDNSWFAIARQADTETPITTPTKFVQNRFPFTALDLDLQSELQASEAIAGRRSDARDQQGQLWGSGSIETQLYTEKMDEFWRAIINSGTPKAVDIPDTTVYATTAFKKTISTATEFTVPTTPGQLEIALTSTDATNHPLPADLGTVEVHGQRRIGLGSKDTLPIVETALEFTDGTAKTAHYFTKVDKVVFTKSTTDLPNVQTAITAKTAQQRNTYKNSDTIFPGWTMQLVRGNVPAVAEGAVPVNSTLTINDNIRLRMEILARKLMPFREIGSDAEVQKIANALKNLDFISDTFYPNWGGCLEVEGVATIFTDLTLNINQNLEFLPGIKASRYRLPVAATNERRNVTLTATVFYDFDASNEKWAQVFADNAPRNLTASCYYWDQDGKETSQKFKLPVSYLTESPRIAIDSRGPITRELAFKGVPLSDTDPDEIEIEMLV